MKKTQRHKHNNRHGKQNRDAPKERALKMPQSPAGKMAACDGAKVAGLSSAPVASILTHASLTPIKGVDDATSTASILAVHSPAASTELDLGGTAERAVTDKPVLSNTAAATHVEGKANGELLAIDSLQSLAPEEREIVRQSDVAFVRVHQTWELWKQVRGGLVVLRDLAMRETGADDTKSKLYKNRFHELLEQRAYRSTQMHPSIRKALLKCAELAPEIFMKLYYEDDARADDLRRVVGQPRDLEELQQKLRSTIMVRQLKQDVLDLPPKHREIRWVDATELPDALIDWFRNERRQIVITHRRLRKAKSRAERRELRERLNALLENVRYEVGIAKFNKVLEYLLSCTVKTLVFAYHHEVIDGLAGALRRAGQNVVTFTGRTRDSVGVVKRFQQDPGCLFFIGNMRAAGIGTTLTAASHVVFAELDWTPAVHHQAEDRAHRIGQAQPVEVVYFILDDDLSTDPQIYQLLKTKQAVSRCALNAAVVSSMTKSTEL
jgi:hypothetical protein